MKVANKPLTELINEMTDADKVFLPVAPAIARQVRQCLTDTKGGSGALWVLVNQDPALLCNLFRAANSSFFAGLNKTINVEEAVTRLGMDKAVEVVERACQEGEGCAKGPLLLRYMPLLWRHFHACALGASWLAHRCGYEALAEQAYLAGMLHDIGKQFLLVALENISSSGEAGIALTEQLVLEVMSSMHVSLGLRLFQEWHLPDVYREIVADHHEDSLDTQNIVVALVRLANKGCRKTGLGLEKQPDLILPTTAEAQFLGIDEVVLAEFEIMLEDRFLGGQPASSRA